MICIACAQGVPDEDHFCENCGSPLRSKAMPERPTNAGCRCGAAVDDVDEDGYCLACGKRVRRPASDHIEEALSPDLAGVSDRGQGHERNEDRFALARGEGKMVLVVCDGVSSTRHAETASEIVAEALRREVGAALQTANGDVEIVLRQAFASAQACLALQGNVRAQEGSPSTTAVVAVVQGTRVSVGWAGDSRAYWLHAGEAVQLTEDHSWLHEVVTSGELTEAEALQAPQAHAITRWLGADAESGVELDVRTHEIEGEGVLLLCSDGLWNYVATPAAMAALVTELSSPEDDALSTARRLVEYANASGGRDNITVALLRIVVDPEAEHTAIAVEPLA